MNSSNDASEGFMSEFAEKLKSNLNVFFHIILKGFSFSVWQAAVVLTLQFLQNLYFIFYPPSDFQWDPESAESGVEFVVKASLVWPYLGETSKEVYFVFFYFCGVALVFVLAAFVVLLAVKGKKKSFLRVALLNVVGFVLLFLQTVFYLPILSKCTASVAMYILFLSCEDGHSVALDNYQCWTTSHYIHLSFGVVFLVLLLVLTVPTTGVYYENNCSSADALRRVSSTADVILKVFQIVMTLTVMLFKGVRVARG